MATQSTHAEEAFVMRRRCVEALKSNGINQANQCCITSKILVGFSLIELLVVLSVVGILLGLALPSFSGTVNSNRLTSAANELITALNFARSEAVRRGQHVVVRKTGTNWENGWRIFVDIDRSSNAAQNVFNSASDVELKVYSALPSTYTLRGNNNFVNFVRYQPDGSSNNIGSFAICQSGNINGAKLVVVNSVGRNRIALDSNHNGIPEDENGIEIRGCTSGF